MRVGSRDRTTGGETADVVDIVVHPGWHWGMTSPTDSSPDFRQWLYDTARGVAAT